MLTTERFDALLISVRQVLGTILQSKNLKIEDITSNYDGPKIEINSSQFMHLLDDIDDLPRNKYMDIGCAILNLEYENIYFSLMRGDVHSGYVYEMMINYTLDHE